MRVCVECGGPNNRRADAKHCSPECRAAEKKRNGYMRDYYQNNKRKWTASSLMRKYGVTLEWWDARLAENGGKCPTCHTDERFVDVRWVVDHDHFSGEPRGVICATCNVALGMAGDSPAVLRALADYLEAHYLGSRSVGA